MTLPLSLVVAVAENGVIGRNNKLAWHLKTDLRRFRDLTMGRPILMGRKTWDSIGRPLPGRESIVVTGSHDFSAPGVRVAHSWPAALIEANHVARALNVGEIAVIGGASLFALALPLARRIHLTLVHARPEGDVLFPDYDRAAFRETRREHHLAGPDDEHPFTFIDLERAA